MIDNELVNDFDWIDDLMDYLQDLSIDADIVDEIIEWKSEHNID